MAKINLKEMMADMPISSFEFASFTKDVTSPDKEGRTATILTFTLTDPISVIASGKVSNPENPSESVYPVLDNVTMVKCNLKFLMDDEGNSIDGLLFDVDEKGKTTGSGSYQGDLHLDISSKDEVWLTDLKFRDFGYGKRNEEKKERYSRYSK